MGRIDRIVLVDKQLEPIAVGESKQMTTDAFETSYGSDNLQEPPYSLEKFVDMAEMHPVHSAALEQKATDIVASGWHWPEDEEVDITSTNPQLPAAKAFTAPAQKTIAKAENAAEWDQLFNNLAGENADNNMLEILHAVQLDYETCAMAYLEVIRDASGKVVKLAHVPAHTVRVHNDKQKFAQVRGEKKVWFSKWGSEEKINYTTGEPLGSDAPRLAATELLVFHKPTRKNSYYGVPMWVSVTGWIMLALAARDYNIAFFENHREPRWVIVLNDLEADANIDDAIREAFAHDLRHPHRNLIIPITGSGNIKFQKLTSETNDASFKNLLEICDTQILVGHRMPPERIGVARVGPLGGNVANVANRVYKEGLVKPGQAVLEHRINNFLQVEFGLTGRRWALNDLDLTEEEIDIDKAIKLFRWNIARLNEARKIAGLPPLSEKDLGEAFLWQLQTWQQIAIDNNEIDREEKEQAMNDKIDELTNLVVEARELPPPPPPPPSQDEPVDPGETAAAAANI